MPTSKPIQPSVLRRVFAWAAGFALALGIGAIPSQGEEIVLKSGMKYSGSVGKIKSLNSATVAPGGNVQANAAPDTIVLVDDNLRRTFFSAFQVQAVNPNPGGNEEKITITQPVATAGGKVASVGYTVFVAPFDEFGRRILKFASPQGPIDVVQGITEITPVYSRVQGLMASKAYVWDMRIATSSIPRETLSRILQKQIDRKNVDERLKIVRIFVQAERYQDARRELEEVLKEFPDQAELKQQLAVLAQLGAKRLIKEIELRRDAGQHHLVYDNLLANFPTEGVDGATLVQVRQMREEYKAVAEKGATILKLLPKHLAQIQDSAVRGHFAGPVEEIIKELNINTLERMGDYLRLSDDESLKPEQKLALALSGWLLGQGNADEKPDLALSLIRVREKIRTYLLSTKKVERDEILKAISADAGVSPEYLAKLLAHMKPPFGLPEPDSKIAGLYKLSTPGADGTPVTYFVQLPPEYDPYRSYPAIVTLRGAVTSTAQQIDWWAGAYDKDTQLRMGQASRRGYIVIAPDWLRDHQTEYEFTAAEHAAVLGSLRDACRRFSVDTNRVFLSGHSIGGDAAWDIGMAHPDLWAGVLPIAGLAGKYVTRMVHNGRYVPLYLVGGELDGGHTALNAPTLDIYLSRTGYDSTFVEYHGRGHDHFQDEIQRIFQWMEGHTRNAEVKEFLCDSMRPWDNYFWWLELGQFPERAIVTPESWPPPRNFRVAETKGKIMSAGGTNTIHVETPAASGTIWLTPELVNFKNKVIATLNGQTVTITAVPSSAVILEDVRTRGDRIHPFWAKMEFSPKAGK